MRNLNIIHIFFCYLPLDIFNVKMYIVCKNEVKKLSKIIAIGGGNIAEGDTLAIDEYIVQSANKNNPKLLFLPTACEDNLDYINNVKIVFEDLGCQVNSLCLISSMLSNKKIEQEIFSSDIIYVGGGDTASMLKTWKTYGIDKMLIAAYKKGIEQAVKETVYVEKEKLIEKCVDRATVELTKKAFPKLIDKFADMGKEVE